MDSTDCASCGKPDALKKCSACKEVVYCDKECQKNHWKANHKFSCGGVSPEAQLSIPRPPISSSRLSNEYSRVLGMLLNMSMTLVCMKNLCPAVPPTAITVMEDVEKLREIKSAKSMLTQRAILDSVYEHMDAKIFPELTDPDLTRNNALRTEVAVECSRWSTERMEGTFYILYDRPDGTIVIPEDKSKVFLVRGFTKSLGSTIVMVPTAAQMALLPFRDVITYDRVIIARAILTDEEKTKEFRADLFVRAAHAEKTGKLIRKIERPKKNPQLITPTVLHKASIFKTAMEDRDFRIDPRNFYLWKRQGYEPRQNPDKILMVMDAHSGDCISRRKMPDYEPSLDDVLTELILQTTRAKTPFFPKYMAIDYEPLVAPLNALIEGTGITFEHFQDPREELQLHRP